MANAVDEPRRALFFHDAADSEELCDEALRCQSYTVSSHIYPTIFSGLEYTADTVRRRRECPTGIRWVSAYLSSLRRPVPRSAGRARRSENGPGQHRIIERASALETARRVFKGVERRRAVGALGALSLAAKVDEAPWLLASSSGISRFGHIALRHA